MRFDARSAKALKPGEHIIVEGCKGLRLEATSTKRTWTYRYKSPVSGLMRQMALGQWPALPPAAAAAEWTRMQATRDAGIDPREQIKEAKAEVQRRVASEKYTVRRLVDDYLAGHVDVHRKPKGAAEVRRVMDKQLGTLANMAPAMVTRSVAFDFLEQRAGTPVQTRLLKQELGAAWDYALDAGRIPETAANWWRLVMRGRLRSKGAVVEGKHVGTSKRVLTGAETAVLIRWLPNFTALADDALTLYLWTGARGAELLSMHASEISEESEGLWWTCPKAKTKNARIASATDLRVPLVGRAETVVRRRMQLAPSGYLFPSKGRYGYVEQKTIGVAVHYRMPHCKTYPALVRARLPVVGWSPHDLRRTARTMLASIGCPDSVAEAILGHVQPGIVGIYNLHSYDHERRIWLQKLNLHLEALAAQR